MPFRLFAKRHFYFMGKDESLPTVALA
jgi:hypothetical protein